MTLFIISFIAGVLTVLAPCVLPLLPVIVGGSLSGEKIHRKKALVVTLSLGVSVIVFTMLLKVSTAFINIPQGVWMWISGIIIILFGLTTLFPDLLNLSKLNIASNKVMTDGMKKNSIWGDIIIGASLGPVFSTCSPTYFIILATVLPQSFFAGFIDLLAYAVGLCISLYLISIVGQKIVGKMDSFADPKGWFKKTLGIVFILVGIMIIVGFDKTIESKLLSMGFFDVTKVEQGLLHTNDNSLNDAPEFVSPNGYINTDGKPINLAQFKGKKVVLLDIWTYSCINCQRTLPYIKQWYEKYKDQGFIVIGIHTPEFGFEKVQANVEKAVKDLGITYPVILDNDYETWNAYGNQYWPRKYLIDLDGKIIYDHIGEGGYDETEMAIQKALGVSKPISEPKDTVTVNPRMVASPELYFGLNRNDTLENYKVKFDGKWNITPEYSENNEPATITYTYMAKNVYIVASSDLSNQIDVYVDDKKIKTVDIKDEKLYNLVEGVDYGTHKLTLKILKKGLKAFTFTFG